MEGLPVDCRIGGRLCGKCCVKAIVPLTREDLDRLREVGVRVEDVIDQRFGVPVLRLVRGRCVFLDDKTGACRIYPHRPEACRLYPLVLGNVWVTVDPACPKADKVPRELAEKLAPRVLEFYEKVKLSWSHGL